MSVYDKAQELAQAIQADEDYQALLAAGKKLAEDEKTMKHVQEFLSLQAQLAYAQAAGDKPVRKKLEQLQRAQEIVQSRPLAVEYLEKYVKWNQVGGQILATIQQAMAEGLSILDK
ncbi:YlbF family regulator [Megasphaera hominis]|jgi:cell fate (sporulation/competence/biofilm development) regulator YlbF (YheA/YmcA/DUF963 family)|uniref:YlbF family regulator n=1 Tax=Megasphaera hominis TaxID=159836 RepID=A0ABR6VFW8_9FIRM|nr:YlbF family regulator [Megasphaera hominis]MBC3536144.1 YlbF family regulator [Megasphaera hominis]